jgi:hypothetical protein
VCDKTPMNDERKSILLVLCFVVFLKWSVSATIRGYTGISTRSTATAFTPGQKIPPTYKYA